MRLLEAGADEVLIAPVDARELEARIEALLVRFQRSSTPGRGPRSSRRRRGAGGGRSPSSARAAASGRRPSPSTSPWRSRAASTRARRSSTSPGRSDRSPRTWTSAAPDARAARQGRGRAPRPVAHAAVRHRHASGLDVLAAPGTWEPSALLGGDGTQLLVDTAMLAYDVVVVDAGSSTDERTVAALQRCDAIVLAVRPEIAALRALHSLADSLTLNGIEVDRAIFVLNDLFAREDLKARDIETALGRRPAVELPYDPVVYAKAVNEGVPVVPARRRRRPRRPSPASPRSPSATARPRTRPGSSRSRRCRPSAGLPVSSGASSGNAATGEGRDPIVLSPRAGRPRHHPRVLRAHDGRVRRERRDPPGGDPDAGRRPRPRPHVPHVRRARVAGPRHAPDRRLLRHRRRRLVLRGVHGEQLRLVLRRRTTRTRSGRGSAACPSSSSSSGASSSTPRTCSSTGSRAWAASRAGGRGSDGSGGPRSSASRPGRSCPRSTSWSTPSPCPGLERRPRRAVLVVVGRRLLPARAHRVEGGGRDPGRELRRLGLHPVLHHVRLHARLPPPGPPHGDAVRCRAAARLRLPVRHVRRRARRHGLVRPGARQGRPYRHLHDGPRARPRGHQAREGPRAGGDDALGRRGPRDLRRSAAARLRDGARPWCRGWDSNPHALAGRGDQDAAGASGGVRISPCFVLGTGPGSPSSGARIPAETDPYATAWCYQRAPRSRLAERVACPVRRNRPKVTEPGRRAGRYRAWIIPGSPRARPWRTGRRPEAWRRSGRREAAAGCSGPRSRTRRPRGCPRGWW